MNIDDMILEAQKMYGIDGSEAQQQICAYISAGDVSSDDYTDADISQMMRDLFE